MRILNQQLLLQLSAITDEEKEILNGSKTINREIYMHGQGNTINSRKLLAVGKLITIRPHTRFIHFPEHRHDYVEVIYMCSGQTTHIVGGKRICLKQGELLFLSQSTTHEVCLADTLDVAVNFIVLPEFFSKPLSLIGEEPTPLRQFLVDCLCGQNTGPGYLHFQVADVPTVQNLTENLLWTLLNDTANKRKVSQMTMALLFMQLLSHTDTLTADSMEEAAVLKVLRCIEANYVNCSLQDISAQLHYDASWLSREIKRKTGKTYTQLVQEKRLAQAAFLIRNTDRNIADIALAVGYENISYFHRIFFAAFAKSPKRYRDEP